MNHLLTPRKASPPTRRAGLGALLCAVLLGLPGLSDRLSAQQQVTVSDEGHFYYAILETDSGRIISQGLMDFGGIDQVILAPRTDYTMYALFSLNLGVGMTEFTSAGNGMQTVIPTIGYFDIEDYDTDEDGLSDLREFIVGTNLFNPDTDGDGVNDGPEVVQGLNPLDGFIVQTGIVGAGVLRGGNTICVSNNLAIVGQAAIGITVFNVTDIAEPIRIADVPIDGTIRDVDCAGRLVSVAADTGGLAVVDITDPPSAFIARTLHFGSPTNCVKMNGNQAYVGLQNGTIVWVDLRTGVELGRIKPTSDPIADLGLGRNVLYAVAGLQFFSIDIRFGQFAREHTLGLTGGLPFGVHTRQLFVGDTYALLNHLRGFMSIDLTDPLAPALGNFSDSGEFGWKWMAANGSGLMVAAAAANGALDGDHSVQLYSIGQDGMDADFLQRFETPDFARSIAIYNGLAYVTDYRSGMQDGKLLVINYLPYDSGGIPPSILLITDAIDNEFEEGKVMTATALVGDDVQVRNVEFFVDGESQIIDGSFPFEFRFATPLITETKDLFTIHAIATDTGGNVAESEQITIQLTPDGTPPFVRKVIPRDNGIVGELDTVAVTFSEVIDLDSLLGAPPADAVPGSSLNPGIRVYHEGVDGFAGTEDDELVDGSLSFDEDTLTAYFDFAVPAIEGTYLVRVLTLLTDLAGNALNAEHVSRFTQAGFEDSDLDGLPDNVEVILEMDPFNPDTDGDGIIDGLEDNDGDGLVNTAEILYLTDPAIRDTDENGTDDGDEDFDNDTLTNIQEFENSSDPYLVDSDGDGYDDAGEVAEGSSPADPLSQPLLSVVSSPTAYFNEDTYGLHGMPDFFLRSSPVSVLNREHWQLPAGTRATVSSAGAAYRNTSTYDESVPPGTSMTIPSGSASYENTFE